MVSVAEVVLGDGLEAVAAPGDVHPPHPGHDLAHLPAEQGGAGLACSSNITVQYSTVHYSAASQAAFAASSFSSWFSKKSSLIQIRFDITWNNESRTRIQATRSVDIYFVDAFNFL